MVDLADALGVDPEGGEVADARADFEAASEELTAAASSGVNVLPVFATEADGWWMAKAPDDPQLALYQELDVNLVDPGGGTTSGTRWAGKRCPTTRATSCSTRCGSA